MPFIIWCANGSAGGNNGLKSLIAHLGTENFPHLLISTANDTLRNKIDDFDFVLSEFTSEEYEKLPQILKQISDFIDKR